jgi:hypothetical protein
MSVFVSTKDSHECIYLRLPLNQKDKRSTPDPQIQTKSNTRQTPDPRQLQTYNSIYFMYLIELSIQKPLM